ncbi:FAD-dependent oxidoreductase [Nocardia tengchongensis]|uniref:FAD-dependent oxidoreductase n=1 Tax=Nocardia tengchongensis TaxID=2055889 RepID=A0ABX8CLU6_9NOCA|nr:FAD-dependent oxidoreductase [Nocardia tengchongensis]QVI19150.1 FAD-dependent oxidoreductase [Nocardia tengchongensis]
MAPAKIVIIGGGFAGVECARALERRLRPEEAFVQLVSPDAGLLYLPLLPQVASGVLNPRSVSVPLRRVLRRTEVVPGMAVGVEPGTRRVVVRRTSGYETALEYDQLVLAPGSITRIMDVPGLQEHGFGMKTLAEAMYLRDHVLRQLDVAALRGGIDEDRERLNFVTIGAGYAGTETAAVLNKVCRAAAGRFFPEVEAGMVRWHLVTHGDRIMPELGEKLGAEAKRILAERGIELITGASAAEVTANGVKLTNGRFIPSRTVLWTAGVAPSPLAAHLGAETEKGRIIARTDLSVPGLPGVWAMGDAAAVPVTADGQDQVCAPTRSTPCARGGTWPRTSPRPCAVGSPSPTGTRIWAWWSTWVGGTRWPGRWASDCAVCPRNSWRAATTSWHCAPSSREPGWRSTGPCTGSVATTSCASATATTRFTPSAVSSSPAATCPPTRCRGW